LTPTVSFYLVQIIVNVNIDVRDGPAVETRLYVEGIRFDVADERVGAIALKTVHLPVKRLVVSKTPTCATFGAAFKCINHFDHGADDIY